jgi:hypothetical protein
MKKPLIIALLLIVTSLIIIALFNYYKKNNQSIVSGNQIDTTLQHKHIWLKQLAFCSCLKYSFKNDTNIKNDLSFTVYKQIADYDSETYRMIDNSAKIAAFKIQPSQIADYNGKKAIITGCFAYYESIQLDSLVKKFDNQLNSR